MPRGTGKRILSLFSVLGLSVTPQPASSGCGVHCPLPARSYVAVTPVVTTSIVEVAVPVVAVSFAYLAPPAPAVAAQDLSGARPQPDSGLSVLPERSHYAAEPFDSAESRSVGTDQTAHGAGRDARRGIAALLQQRCASCHQQQAKGGVRLLNAAGSVQLSRNGQPLAKQTVAAAVLSGHMPPSGPLGPEEKLTVAQWAME